MQMRGTYLMFAAMIGFAVIVLQGCFEATDPYWSPARQAHEEREFRHGPKHEVCDAYGNNCMVCDADNDLPTATQHLWLLSLTRGGYVD